MNRIVILMAAAIALPAQADWMLDGEQSELSFVSTKAINVAEVHRFGDLSGSISADGQVVIAISLASVDTGIELRDERMREMLFDTSEYGLATVSAKIDPAEITGLDAGDSKRMVVEANVMLHGVSRPLPVELMVARSGDSRLIVTSAKPVVVNAPEFDLGAGVEALREIAGLPSISLAVPVSFVLTFDTD